MFVVRSAVVCWAPCRGFSGAGRFAPEVAACASFRRQEYPSVSESWDFPRTLRKPRGWTSLPRIRSDYLPIIEIRGICKLDICQNFRSVRRLPWRVQKSKVAPPPPESPPPKRTSGRTVCGLGVIACGNTRPNAADPAFIQSPKGTDRNEVGSRVDDREGILRASLGPGVSGNFLPIRML